MPSPDIVEIAVVGFTDDWIDGADIPVFGNGQHIVHDAIGGLPGVQRIGQDDRSLDLAQLANLGRANKLPEPVSDEHCGSDFFGEEVTVMGKDRCRACADGISSNQSDMTDEHTTNISDRVEWPPRKNPRLEADLESPGAFLPAQRG